MLFPSKSFEQTIFNCDAGDEIVDCSNRHDMNYIFTENNIYSIKKKKKIQLRCTKEIILRGITTNGYVWIITNSGIQKARIENGYFSDFEKVGLPMVDYNTMKIYNDPLNPELVWVTTQNEGIYTISEKGQIKLILKVSMLNDISIVSTSDYWMGTDVGLIHRINGITYKYNEEGVAGYEIPDNIVEKLYSNGKQLLVQMSKPLCLFNLEGENTDSHGEGIDFIGSKDNIIYDAYLLDKGSVIFATKENLVYVSKDNLTKSNITNINHEVYEESNRYGAHVISKTKLNIHDLAKNEEIVKILSGGRDKILLICKHKVYQVSIKACLP